MDQACRRPRRRRGGVAGRWSAAYYVAGYSVECGLKACIVEYLGTNPGVIFRERGYSDRCWNHDIEKLVDAAGLKAARDTDAAANAELGKNWLIVKDWTENSRNEQKTEPQVRKLFDAVTDPQDGVLEWIKARW